MTNSLSVLDQSAKAFEKVASTTERVGIPVGVFAAGAITLFLSIQVPISILPWLGALLIVSSLGTYVWLTDRSTAKWQSPPPPLQPELKEILDWMMDQHKRQDQWMRTIAESSIPSIKSEDTPLGKEQP